MTTLNWHKNASEIRFRVCNIINGQSLDQINKTCSDNSIITKYSPRDGSWLYQYHSGKCVGTTSPDFMDGEKFNYRETLLRG